MAKKSVLSQDEIDALLTNIDEPTTQLSSSDGEVTAFNFADKKRVVGGRMTGLFGINERFIRNMRTSLMNQLRRTVDVSLVSLETLEAKEFLSTIAIPSCINLIRIRPLLGTALMVLETGLVYSLVETLFGGGTGYIESKDTIQTKQEFTQTEMRIVQLVMDLAFEDLKKSWESIMNVDFELISSEINPALVNVIAPKDIIVLKRFRIDLDYGGGQLNIAIPYSMLEPIRSKLEDDSSGSDEINEKWAQALREEMMHVNVELSGNLAETQIKLSELVNLKPDDIIPIEMNESVLIRAHEMPIFRAKFGVSGKNRALKFIKKIDREHE